MATSISICDSCMTDDTTQSASVWCSECKEAMCNDCEKQHNRMKLTKNHKTILIEDYLKLSGSVTDINQECKVHNRKFDFYCLIHNDPCCVSCVSQNHDTCKEFKPLIEVVKGVKSSAAFEDLEDRAKDISDLISNLIKDKQGQKASFELQKNEIISGVQNVRQAIKNHLDKLQTDILAKLDNEEKTKCESFDKFIEKISEMRKNVDEMLNDLKQIKKLASDFQAFLGLHEWNKIIEIEEKNWMSLQIDKIMNTFDIHIEFWPILLKFEKNIKELGKLFVTLCSSQKILLKKEKQGQTLISMSSTIDNIKLTRNCSFQTPIGSSRNPIISGIGMFDDSRIVLADQSSNNRLVIMNQDGGFIKTIKLESQCFDVAVIEKYTVATTLVGKKKIAFVDINSSKVQRSIPTNNRCLGLTYSGEQLVVSLDEGRIKFFDLSGNTLSTLSVAGKSSYCSVFDNHLYHTTHRSDAVYEVELNGEVRWKFDCQKSDLPLGITNDASGNIFVTCNASNQLMVVGKDGKKSRILFTKEDGLHKHLAIHYDRKSYTLLVCNESGKCFVYTVT